MTEITAEDFGLPEQEYYYTFGECTQWIDGYFTVYQQPSDCIITSEPLNLNLDNFVIDGYNGSYSIGAHVSHNDIEYTYVPVDYYQGTDGDVSISYENGAVLFIPGQEDDADNG